MGHPASLTVTWRWVSRDFAAGWITIWQGTEKPFLDGRVFMGGKDRLCISICYEEWFEVMKMKINKGACIKLAFSSAAAEGSA